MDPVTSNVKARLAAVADSSARRKRPGGSRATSRWTYWLLKSGREKVRSTADPPERSGQLRHQTYTNGKHIVFNHLPR